MDNNLNQNTPDIGDILAKLTSDPSMMEQISKLAESFKNTSSEPNVEETNAEIDSPDDSVPASSITGKSNNFNIDNHAQLFKALKPYLNSERKETLDYIIQLFNVIKLLEASGFNLNKIIPTFNNTSTTHNKNEISKE